MYHTYMNITYKSNNNIVYSCKYHVVWCPKYRRKILTNGIDTRLKELLLAYAANISVDIMEMEIMPDHVHILNSILRTRKPHNDKRINKVNTKRGKVSNLPK